MKILSWESPQADLEYFIYLELGFGILIFVIFTTIAEFHVHMTIQLTLLPNPRPGNPKSASSLPIPLILDTLLRATFGGRPTVKQAQTHPSLPVNWKVDKSKIRLALKMAVPWKSPYCEAGGVSWMRHVRLSPSKTIPSKSLNSIYVGTGPPAPFSPNE